MDSKIDARINLSDGLGIGGDYVERKGDDDDDDDDFWGRVE